MHTDDTILNKVSLKLIFQLSGCFFFPNKSVHMNFFDGDLASFMPSGTNRQPSLQVSQ